MSSRKSHEGDAETLRRYWTTGEGGAKIRWGTSGDFSRCVREVGRFMPGQAKGYCANLHHRATGEWPAQHAARDKQTRRQRIRAALTRKG